VPRPYSMGKRAKEKDRVRREIERALIRVLASLPYDTVTMTHIAREADVSARTVQRHFRSKDQVLAAALRFPAAALAEEMSARPAPESAGQAIGHLVDALFAIYNRHRPELWAAYTRSAQVPELMRAQGVAIAAWLAAVERIFSRWPDVWAIDPRTAKRAIISFTSYPAWRGFAGAGGFGPPEAERFVTDVLCRYLLREGQASREQPPS
jgi:AcrR family transcriptional regulator